MKKVVNTIIVALTMVSHGFGQNSFFVSNEKWKMQRIPIATRWASDVNPSNPLNEYPRPQLVRNNWQNLNGLWQYAITPKNAVAPNRFDGKILVPFAIESALSGVKKPLLPSQNLWYKRTIKKPILKAGQRLLLHFGAVDWQASVFINGKLVGGHSGGYQSFYFDVTNYLRAGENELLVKVYDPTDKGINPHGKQVLNPGNIYYTSTSGIWQTVWLETVSSGYVTNLILTPNIDKEVLTLTAQTAGAIESCKLEVIISSGKKLVTKAVGMANGVFLFQIKSAHLWSPDDPFLYDVSVRLLKSGKVIDEVKSYFGMRKVSIEKDSLGQERIFLNNKATFNLGVLDQGFWPEGLYTAPTDEALAFDIKAIKSMGFNTIRKHIKIEPDRWYYHADKIGILVWQDFVNPPHDLPEGAKAVFEKEVAETICQLDNHPCITTWILFNEQWGAYDQQRISDWIKTMDPFRIVDSHSGELLYLETNLAKKTDTPWVGGDLTDVHSYPDPMNAPGQSTKARVLGEFGGIGVSVPEHEWSDLHGWGYVQLWPTEFRKKYSEMVKRLIKLEADGLSGAIYTQPFDVEGEENGLLTYDRAIIKIPVNELRQMNRLVTQSNGFELNSTFFLAKDIDTTNIDNQYVELLRQYDKGKRDSSFLRRLVLLGMRKNDQITVTRIGNDYISHLKQIYSKENLLFIRQITRTSQDTGFKLFIMQSNKINTILGANQAEYKVKQIIRKEEIEPYTTADSVEPNWAAITKSVVEKYGPIGQETVFGQQMYYYWAVSKNWALLGKYYKLYYELALDRSEYHINNVSWDIFLHVDDKEVLEFAAVVARYNVEKLDNSPEAFDTYANLLYKLGRVSDAITWQQKAVNLSNNGQAFIETIEKMKKGVPTWGSQ